MSHADTIQGICDHANQVIASLPSVALIDTEAALDDALATCPEGAVIVLANSLNYSRTLAIPKPVILQSESYSPNNTTRMGWDEPAPTFHGGIIGHMRDHALLGIAMKGTETVAVMGGENAIWDRCRILGDSYTGARRGIRWTGTNGFIRRAYIDDIFRTDQDTQAICGWDSGAGLVIDDCYLSAAGQSVMFGGGDSTSAERIPRVIWMHHSTLTKKQHWAEPPHEAAGGLQQCKCALEFKSCIDCKVEFCDFHFGGCAMGQGYHLIVATPRIRTARPRGQRSSASRSSTASATRPAGSPISWARTTCTRQGRWRISGCTTASSRISTARWVRGGCSCSATRRPVFACSACASAARTTARSGSSTARRRPAS